MAVKPLTSVLKTLSIFETIAGSSAPMRLADVARSCGEARGAVHQRLVTLVEAGLLEVDGEGRYRLTLRSVAHAAAAMEQANLGTRMSGLLEQMVRDSGETASLAVLDGDHAMIARRVESQGILRADLKVGAVLDLDWTASGRVLITWMSEAQRAYLRERGALLPSDEILRQTLETGWAESEARGPRTVAAVAAPLLDAQGHCRGALTISGPREGFDREQAVKVVVDAAQRASNDLKGE